jgi:streptomycin 6-kinase
MTEADQSWQALLPPILRDAGIADGGAIDVQPLTGGVSSDIVLVRLGDGRAFCAKRALGKLKVASDWRVPVERNHYEVAWFRRAGAIVPGAAPKVLGEDRAHGIALIEYLPPEEYVLWKEELLAGRADPRVSVSVADAIGRIHAATLQDPAVAAEFPTDGLFDALRLDPYLRTLTKAYPELADALNERIAVTAGTRIALVHGDLSPKNILVSRSDGHPVILDAECAWYGDPAFDAAFCLNHLVLKAVHMPRLAGELLSEAQAFADTWLGHFPPALRTGLEERTAALLPALMLARVDGKSPVEYLRPAVRQTVRDIAIPLIKKPAGTLDGTAEAVRRGIGVQ